jgi:hypothetical protein
MRFIVPPEAANRISRHATTMPMIHIAMAVVSGPGGA